VSSQVSIPSPTGDQLHTTPHTITPGPILLLGAPGAGKGTQAQSIVSRWAIPQISTGDLLRGNVANGTELGKSAKEIMARGDFVSDELVNQMVAVRLTQPDTANGYILDGFPRTIGQAQWLDAHVAAAAGSLPVIAVSIKVSYTELLRRITGRRSCPTCQRIYNIYLQPPKTDTVCDVDGTPLVARADDTEEVFAERMRIYEELTTPVIEHYRTQGRFAEVDGGGPVESVTAGVLAAVEGLRSSS
jgi:adenylate kinase